MVTPRQTHPSPPPSGIIVEGLEIQALDIPALKIFRAEPKQDIRGTVTPTFNRLFLEKLDIAFEIVHANPKNGPFEGFITNCLPTGKPNSSE